MLPNGQPGELRLLRGDGIFGPDLVRALILDAKGNLLARSHRSHLIAVSCAAACKVFDLGSDTVLELEPSSFRSGQIVPGLGDEDRDRLWPLEAGDDAWGFRVRPATAIERIEGNWAMVTDGPIQFVLLALPGVIAALIGLMILKSFRRRGMPVMRALAICAATLGTGCLVVIGFLLAILGSFTTELWLAATLIGVLAVLAISQLVALRTQ